LIVSLPLFPIFLISKHDHSESLLPRPQREGMMQGLALAEMPEIDQRVCQGFQGVMQLADPLEAQQ